MMLLLVGARPVFDSGGGSRKDTLSRIHYQKRI